MSFAETLFTKIVAGEIPSFKVYEVSIHLYRDDIPITKIINLFFCLYLFPYIHHLTLFSHRYVHSHVSPIHHKILPTKQKSTNTNPFSKLSPHHVIIIQFMNNNKTIPIGRPHLRFS